MQSAFYVYIRKKPKPFTLREGKGATIRRTWRLPPGNRRKKILEFSRVNVPNPSPCLRQVESWRPMPLYQGFPLAGRWLNKNRVSGSWRLSFVYLRYCGPSQAHCSVWHFIKTVAIRVYPDVFVGKYLTVRRGAKPDLGPASVRRLARGELSRTCARPNSKAPPYSQDAPGRAARPRLIGLIGISFCAPAIH